MSSVVGIKRITTVEELRSWRSELYSDMEALAKPVLGFVPTMGALHEGHIALVRRAVAECQNVIVSIFVNPLQFGPHEDLDRYPRTLEADIELCRQAGATAVFHPDVKEMYRHGQEEVTIVTPPEDLINRLCGLFRPGHFAGVATVVAKLFCQVQPDVAYFGQKDYQQLVVVKKMVGDLDLPVRIVGVTTVRESDGLALSSRNTYLSAEQRQLAPQLYKILCSVRDAMRIRRTPVTSALKDGRNAIQALPGVSLQYLEACHPETLQPIGSPSDPAIILVAAKVGDVRLIDNLLAD